MQWLLNNKKVWAPILAGLFAIFTALSPLGAVVKDAICLPSPPSAP